MTSHVVTVQPNISQVVLPNGRTYQGGESARLTDAEFRRLTPGALATLLVEGQVEEEGYQEGSADFRLDALEARPVRVPQWAGIPLFGYSHSLMAVAGWHTAGQNMTDRMAAASGCASFTNRGVGGSTMESTGNLITGGSAARWNPGSTKSIGLVMDVINSALNFAVPMDVVKGSLYRSTQAIIAAILCDGYDWTTVAVSGFSGGWAILSTADGRPSVTYPAGSMVYTPTNNVLGVATPPSGVANKQCFLEFLSVPVLANSPNVKVTVTKGGVQTVVHDGQLPISARTGTYSKLVIPCGPMSYGDSVEFRKQGTDETILYYSGFYVDSGKHHAILTEDLEDLPSTMYPQFQHPDRILECNAVVRQAVEDMNVRIPNGASIVDLSRDETHTGLPMMWTGDTLHPNDPGQAWFAGKITRQASKTTPWTSRLHTV